MDQAELEGKNISWHIEKRGTYSTLDCALCLPLFIISKIQSKTWYISHDYTSAVAAQPF